MHDVVGRDETLDAICAQNLRLVQKKKGYRFSIDPILLANFVALKMGQRMLDIGTGCGIIPLYMAARGAGNPMLGIEIQEELYHLAQRNRELNRPDNVQFLKGDIRSLRAATSGLFHVVVSNPPYVKLRTGRSCPTRSRYLARQESVLDLTALLSAAKRLLYSRGRLCLVYPSRRVGEVVFEARARRLEPKRIRFVHPRPGEPSNLFLLECVKDGGPEVTVMEPLYVYRGEAYSDEVQSYYV